MQSQQNTDIPFVDGVYTFSCNHKGRTLSIHDIEVTIPPGAIPDGVTAHIEMGVALYGPFKFPDSHHPVSPILWFCIAEGIEVLLPIKYKLPHVITDVNRVKLTFVKANHLDFSYDSSMNMDVFTFKTVHAGESSIAARYGVLTTKHCCLLCIDAEHVTKDLALQKGYCLHTLVEKVDTSSYRILLVCTYFLRTCFEVRH